MTDELMQALVITDAGKAEVMKVAQPRPAADELLIDVRRAGICGTDVELFTGDMAYLHTGHAHYPLRIGHEWMGVVTDVGRGVNRSWIGKRVTGDTMVGCGSCTRCLSGRQHLCEKRYEIGVRGGRPGALAERLAVPVRSAHELPDTVSDTAGALVEPGANSLRSVVAASLEPTERLLVIGPGAVGLMAAMFARAAGVEVHVLGQSSTSVEFTRSLGIENAWTDDDLPDLPWDAVIDASNGPDVPNRAVRSVEPGRRVVLVGIAGSPSRIDTRDAVLRDVTVVGILSGSPQLSATVASFASGAVDPSPLVGATVALHELPAILAGHRPSHAGPGPKIHVAF